MIPSISGFSSNYPRSVVKKQPCFTAQNNEQNKKNSGMSKFLSFVLLLGFFDILGEILISAYERHNSGKIIEDVTSGNLTLPEVVMESAESIEALGKEAAHTIK